MRYRLLLCCIAILAVGVGIVGCNKDDTDPAPAKAEIDKGLEGKPPINPEDSAAMGAAIKGKKGG